MGIVFVDKSPLFAIVQNALPTPAMAEQACDFAGGKGIATGRNGAPARQFGIIEFPRIDSRNTFRVEPEPFGLTQEPFASVV